MYMSPKAKSIAIGMVIVAILYACVEHGIKPKANEVFGVKVK